MIIIMFGFTLERFSGKLASQVSGNINNETQPFFYGIRPVILLDWGVHGGL